MAIKTRPAAGTLTGSRVINGTRGRTLGILRFYEAAASGVRLPDATPETWVEAHPGFIVGPDRPENWRRFKDEQSAHAWLSANAGR